MVVLWSLLVIAGAIIINIWYEGQWIHNLSLESLTTKSLSTETIVKNTQMVSNSLDGTDSLKDDVSRCKKNRVFNIVIAGFGVLYALLLKSRFPEMSVIDQVRLLGMVLILFPIARKDYKTNIIPNKLIAAGFIYRAFLLCVHIFVSFETLKNTLIKDATGFLFVAVFLGIGLFIVKKGLGMGDVKLFLMLAFFQGLRGIISSMFYSLLFTFFIALYLLLTKRKGKRDSVPFAPSILFGTMISILIIGE